MVQSSGERTLRTVNAIGLKMGTEHQEHVQALDRNYRLARNALDEIMAAVKINPGEFDVRLGEDPLVTSALVRHLARGESHIKQRVKNDGTITQIYESHVPDAYVVQVHTMRYDPYLLASFPDTSESRLIGRDRVKHYFPGFRPPESSRP